MILAMAAFLGFAGFLNAGTPYQTQASGMLLVESEGATRVVEKVCSAVAGVMVEVFVKEGDKVKKGQVLGHLELEATKLQLDLARVAMESKANVDAARGQADAWTATREETEESVRHRTVEQVRLDWAIGMEKMYQAQCQVQLDLERTQLIQYDYWKDQYEKRFFRAPADGVVSEVPLEVGKPVTIGMHVFTVGNDGAYTVPVPVSAALADAAVSLGSLPVRCADGKSVGHAPIDSVTDDPLNKDSKIIHLLVRGADFSAAVRKNLQGMRFDVLLPRLEGNFR